MPRCAQGIPKKVTVGQSEGMIGSQDRVSVILRPRPAVQRLEGWSKMETAKLKLHLRFRHAQLSPRYAKKTQVSHIRSGEATAQLWKTFRSLNM